MPHLVVMLASGRNEAVRCNLADRLAGVVEEVLGLGAKAVSVAVEEVPSAEWMERVYCPDIETAGECLLKRPGYGPLAGPEAGR